jgi:hypothetical protein
MVVYSYNSSTKEVKTGELWVWGQSGLHNIFKVKLSYITKHPPFKKKGEAGDVELSGKTLA